MQRNNRKTKKYGLLQGVKNSETAFQEFQRLDLWKETDIYFKYYFLKRIIYPNKYMRTITHQIENIHKNKTFEEKIWDFVV